MKVRPLPPSGAAVLLLTAALLPVAARGPAAGETAPPAAAAAPADAPDRRMPILAAARDALVKVVLTPRWDENCLLETVADAGENGEGLWLEPERGLLSSRLLPLLDEHANRRTSVLPGALLGGGLVAVADDGNGYDWRLVGKVEIEDRTGRRWPAEPHGLLTAASAVVYRVTGDGVPPAPAFAEEPRPESLEKLAGATLEPDVRDPGRWWVSVGGWRLPWDGGAAAAGRLVRVADAGEGFGGGLRLLFDGEARPVALSLAGQELSPDNAEAWSPPAMLKRGILTYADLGRAEEAARAGCLKWHRKVRFEFRVDEEDDEAASWQSRMMFAAGDGAADAEAFALAVSPRRLLVPRTLQLLALRRVEKISVRVDGKWEPARFVAALTDFDAMVIELPGGGLEPPPALERTAGVQVMRPFVFGAVRELLGEVAAQARDGRCLRRELGYGDRLRLAAREVPPGALLFDSAGRLAGICVRERRVRDLATLAGQQSGRAMYYIREMQDLVPFGRLAPALADPAAHALPTWRPMDRQEERRLVWLGVEFDPIDRELARRLGIEKPTRGGTLGLMVSTVYPGSPAERLGLQAQDVMLRLEVEGLGDPLPLLSATVESGAEAMLQRMSSSSLAGEGPAGRTWRPQSNYLTRLLTEIGPGPSAKLTWHSRARGEVSSGSFRLDYGPPDFDSAEPHKDEGLGLSVKPLTYEVRHALSLPPEAPGVIISRVEPGAAAQLARLVPCMIVTQVQGEPVSSVEAFSRRIAALRAEKVDKVKLQVSAMGRSRFADLQLGD